MHHFNINKIWNHFCLILLFIVISTFTITNVSLAGNYSDDWPPGGVVWDHTNVSGWAVTSNLASVVVSGGGITYNHDKSCSWPMYDRSVNANAWVIHKESDGKWHANTWDFMRKCQLTKDASHVGWVGGRPRAGQTYYFLVSGIARPGYGQTIQARSNIVKLVWGSSAVGTALSPCTSAPSITSFAATPTSVSSGESSKLNWNVTGASSLSLTATSNGSAQTTAIDSSLSNLTTTPDATTVNILKAKNSCGETTSDSVTVTVNKGLPFMDALLLSPGAQITTKDVEPTTITGVYALLLGEVTTPHNNEDATLSFEYGETDSYEIGSVDATPPTAAGDNVAFEAGIDNLSNGTTYYYRAKGVFAQKTTYGEMKSFTTHDVPTATTLAATDMTNIAATLHADVNPNGAETTVTFEYEPDATYTLNTYTMTSDPTIVPAGSSAVTVDQSITGLSAGTVYHFRVKAENAVGAPVYGADMQFTTDDVPDATTNEATNVLEESVTLTGTVDPKGDDATVTFEYGTTSTVYGPGVDGSPSVISTTGSSIYNLTGLSKGTTIYYRIVAQNDYGTDFGEEKEVTTDDDPLSVTGEATDPNPTTGTATGNGEVTANGSAITYANCLVGIAEGGPYPFSYPINESLPTAEDAISLPVTCSITNLSTGNTYYYILRSTNSVGTHDGEEQTIVLSSDS